MMNEQHTAIPFDLSFGPSPAEASRARQSARAYLDAEQVPTAVAADLELVVSELAANAIEQQPDQPVRLTVHIRTDGVEVAVANATTDYCKPTTEWRVPDQHLPSKTRERGYGLEIVDALTDRLWYRHTDGWTSVTCFRRFD